MEGPKSSDDTIFGSADSSLYKSVIEAMNSSDDPSHLRLLHGKKSSLIYILLTRDGKIPDYVNQEEVEQMNEYSLITAFSFMTLNLLYCKQDKARAFNFLLGVFCNSVIKSIGEHLVDSGYGKKEDGKFIIEIDEDEANNDPIIMREIAVFKQLFEEITKRAAEPD